MLRTVSRLIRNRVQPAVAVQPVGYSTEKPFRGETNVSVSAGIGIDEPAGPAPDGGAGSGVRLGLGVGEGLGLERAVGVGRTAGPFTPGRSCRPTIAMLARPIAGYLATAGCPLGPDVAPASPGVEFDAFAFAGGRVYMLQLLGHVDRACFQAILATVQHAGRDACRPGRGDLPALDRRSKRPPCRKAAQERPDVPPPTAGSPGAAAVCA